MELNKKQASRRSGVMRMVGVIIAFLIPLTAMIFAAQNYREYNRNKRDEAMLIEKQKDAEIVATKVYGLSRVLEKIVDQHFPLNVNLPQTGDENFKFDIVCP